MISFEQFDAAGTATDAGLFIPVADLPGVDAAELDGTTAGSDKAVLALLNVFYNTLSPTAFDKLGISVAKPNPTGQGSDLIAQNYSMVVDYLVDHEAQAIEMIPVPTTGTQDGVGAIALADLFPTAAAVAAAGATTAGIVIPNDELAGYGAPLAASIPADARGYLSSLYHYIVGEADVRSADTASAITAKTRGAATGFTPPPAWTQATNPVSGIAAADLIKRSFFRTTLSITVQLLLDQETQTFDVNSVTS
jgi:hypothetical protein